MKILFGLKKTNKKKQQKKKTKQKKKKKKKKKTTKKKKKKKKKTTMARIKPFCAQVVTTKSFALNHGKRLQIYFLCVNC